MWKLQITILIAAILCAPVLCAQAAAKTASTVKTSRQEHREYFDDKKTKLKLLEEFYEVKELDADDKVISTTKVFDGYRLEWVENGKEKRKLDGNIGGDRENIPPGQFKLVEYYEDGKLTERHEYYPSGKLKKSSRYRGGSLDCTTEYYDTARQGDGNFRLCQTYRFDKVTRSGWYREDGKCEKEESYTKTGAVSERSTYEYHEEGNLKLEQKETFFSPELGAAELVKNRDRVEYYENRRLKEKLVLRNEYDERGKLKRATSTLITQTEEGLQTKYVNDHKVEEGKLKLVRTSSSDALDEVKDGEWRYWNEAGKLLKSQTYDDGKLKETREYK